MRSDFLTRFIITGSAILFLAAGCPSKPPKPPESPSQEIRQPSMPIDLETVREIKKRHDQELMEISGVVGTGIARRPSDGAFVIRVYVTSRSEFDLATLPSTLEGIDIEVVERGPFKAR